MECFQREQGCEKTYLYELRKSYSKSWLQNFELISPRKKNRLTT